eukprot:15447992-Alexandrium_andersonii.AAC.1
MKATPKLGTHGRLGHFRKERNVHILIGRSTQAGLPRVNEESPAGPAVAAARTAPPTGCQIGQEEP